MIFPSLKICCASFLATGIVFSVNSHVFASGVYAQLKSEITEDSGKEEPSENSANESDNLSGLEVTEEAVPRANNIVEPETTDSFDNDNSSPGLEELEQFLDERQWEMADEATFNILLSAVGDNSLAQGRFDLSEWEVFLANPENCSLVRQVDALWIQASKGSLGFAAQRRVFQNSEDFRSFYEEIDWLAEDSDDWLVSWDYDSVERKASYISLPNYDDAASIEGYLPGMMEWEPSEDGQILDLRFQMIGACRL
ncbi:GUN4 domain-containing protein [Nodosilinea sp. LEGE 07298]|uniref:GUN4 domain-containing protein n=1 Tax=Nodosilinea sp. LEGE 07298 TaxID=2777970 RepID=UPI001880DCF4|nr:GUN4 domain-containing protein [Nodosilinea sp. LEGE 07298]MBE9109421.1 GUN4 domain-containing protein [Nodosilinea sp. LEGE 07298]